MHWIKGQTLLEIVVFLNKMYLEDQNILSEQKVQAKASNSLQLI